jgi:hypothetical protein
MKKIIFLLPVVLAITTFTSNAQGFHLGIKAGGTATKIDGQPFNNGFTFVYHAGAFAEIDFSRKLGIQPELLFSQSQSQTVSNINQISSPFADGQNIQLNYLSIPILLNFKPVNFITFQVGPQYSILMNKGDNLTTSAQKAFKDGDFSLVGGVQLNLGTIKIYGRYLLGLNNISDVADQGKWTNRQIQAGIALKIF